MNSRLLVICAMTVVIAGAAGAAYQVGDHVNDFTLFDAYGVEVSLYDYRNLVIALCFFRST